MQWLFMDKKKPKNPPQSRVTWLDPVIGANVAKLRIDRGWSQSDLAEKMDQSQSLVTLLENGKKPWNSTTIAKACEVFEIQPYSLFVEAEVDEIYKAYKSLSIDEQGIIRRSLGLDALKSQADAPLITTSGAMLHDRDYPAYEGKPRAGK